MPKKHHPLTCKNEDHDTCLDAQVEAIRKKDGYWTFGCPNCGHQEGVL